MEKYFCSKCNSFHSKGKNYNNHKEFLVELSQAEFFKMKFKNNWKNYSINSHSKTNGSKK